VLCGEVLRSKPMRFRSLTGWTLEAFEEPFARFLPVGPPQGRERLSRPDRRRAIGGRRQDRLSLPNMLRMTLIRLRSYWTIETLAFLWTRPRSAGTPDGCGTPYRSWGRPRWAGLRPHAGGGKDNPGSPGGLPRRVGHDRWNGTTYPAPAGSQGAAATFLRAPPDPYP